MKIFLMFSMMAVGIFVAVLLLSTGIDLVVKAKSKKSLISFKQRLVLSGCVSALLMAILLILAYRPNPLNKTNKGFQARSEIKQLIFAVENFKKECGDFPPNLEILLQASGPECQIQRKEAYIGRIDNDPWGTPYMYQIIKTGFEIISYGADGKPGGSGHEADVIIRR